MCLHSHKNILNVETSVLMKKLLMNVNIIFNNLMFNQVICRTHFLLPTNANVHYLSIGNVTP